MRKMLRRILARSKLTNAVVDADVKDNPSYDVTTRSGRSQSATRRDDEAGARRPGHEAHRSSAGKVPRVAQAEGQVEGARRAKGSGIARTTASRLTRSPRS